MYCCKCLKVYECFEDHVKCVATFPSALDWVRESKRITEKANEPAYTALQCFGLVDRTLYDPLLPQ